LAAFLAFLALLAPPSFADDYALYQKSGQRSEKWDGMVKAAFQAMDSGDLQTGFVFMQKAYNSGCRDGLLLFKLGIYYESVKKYKDAATYLEQAAQKLPGQYPDYEHTKRIHEHLGRLYYQADQFDKAIAEIDQALKTDPNNFMLLFMSAQIYRSQKNYQQAIATFEKALQQIPPTPPLQRGARGDLQPDPKKIILTELMGLYYEMKDFPNCLKYADQVLAIAPNDQRALSYKRNIQMFQYKQREREAIKKIIE